MSSIIFHHYKFWHARFVKKTPPNADTNNTIEAQNNDIKFPVREKQKKYYRARLVKNNKPRH